MNIFESIRRATSQIERFHSQFLADALQDSIEGDRSLFEAVWRLTTPDKPDRWDVPVEATIVAEEVVPGQGRIDISIKCASPKRRIVGIEVKSTDSSVTPGQLERYRKGLVDKFLEYEVAIAYLTPFNRQWALDKADVLPTVKEFEEFRKIHPTAKHVSWLDIAGISWNGNELWRQHQLFVKKYISSHKRLSESMTRDRSLDEFFGEEPVAAFWEDLLKLGIQSSDGGAVIQLAKFDGTPDFANRLAQSFETLIMDGDGIARAANREDVFPEDLRGRFLDSQYGKVHEALFTLAKDHSHVWVEGKQDYGLRVAHVNVKHGVSLVRSHGPERLEIRGRR